MTSLSLVLGIAYLLLHVGSSLAQVCQCRRKSEGKITLITNDDILISRGEVVEINCLRKTFDGDRLTWEMTANKSSKSVDMCNAKQDTSNCWRYVSTLSRILTIRSALIDAPRRQFVCRLEYYYPPTKCCTVNIVIPHNTKPTETTTTTKILTAKFQQKRLNSTTTNVNSDTPAPTNQSYITSFPNASYETFTFRQTATISATVCVIAVLLIGVGVAVLLVVLKRKRRSNDVTSNDSTDKMTYLLDAKERQIWNGNKIIPIGCLSVGKLLGEGQFGTVTEGQLRTASKQGEIYDKRIAIKMLIGTEHRITDREGVKAKELRKEAEIIVNLGQHKNVIFVYGYCVEDECVSKIVMEYAELGDLHRHLRKLRSVGLDNTKQIAFGQQIAEGMNFVVSKGCVHRDLAARNVLVCAGQRLKISDFGLAKDLQSAAYYRKKSRGGVLPFRWCAPEVLLYRTYSEYSDVWSYGIVLWEIATLGGTPYPGIPVEKLFELLTGKADYRMSKPRNCSQKLYDVMDLCWNSVPDRRPTFSKITAEYMQFSDV
ncbi:fibroblast growth factor receptor 3-like isoform X2 [Oscarella lobularis]|uniref:fibroblast growth factor receptor 3-like isoform X2 n=1 Tax=Oscarella lobularis TaxID=121494 RepID=UPI0033131B69